MAARLTLRRAFPSRSTHRHPHRPYSTLPKGDLIEELDSRGLIQTQTSRSLRPHLASSSRTVYTGVDPSASSLHVGNLLPLFTLAHFARYNHHPIVLVGGATGSIGDPSGRSTERNALDKNTLTANVEGVKTQLRVFFRNVADYYGRSPDESSSIGGGEEEEGVELGLGVRLMNNLSWTKDVTLLDFLGSVGRHARLAQMLARESVSSRLATSSGMSYTEFSYQLLQAFDFAHLHSTHSCTIQIGGSDQLGNIVAGIDLIRRTTGGLKSLEDDPAFGLTLPLLTTAGGEKFGKSAGNAVWLDRERTSDLDFYQFFLRSADDDVERYLKALTLLEVSSVEEIMAEHAGDRKARRAQRVLADHITTLIRGKDAAQKSKALTKILFSHTLHSGDPVDAAKSALRELQLNAITESDNIVTKLEGQRVVGDDLTKVVVAAGLVKSRGEAKRLLSAGGLYVNNRQVKAGEEISEADLVETPGGAVCLLRAGKSAVRVVHVSS